MSTEKILIVTYYWPPSGGAAVQRWLSLCNELARRSWEVHVLTVDEKYATYQLYDQSLKNDIDAAINVHTTKTREPFGLYKFLFGKNSIPKPAFANEQNPSLLKKFTRFIRGNLFIPDPRKGWKNIAVKKALEIVTAHDIRHIITAGPPHSTHFIGKAVKEKNSIRWIADFHDLWTDIIYYDMLYHLPFVKKLDKKLERLILESADDILTVGEKYKEKLLEKSTAIAPGKIHIIRIGYNAKEFESAKRETGRQAAFVISYIGTIAGFYEPAVFIKALKTVVAHYPEVPVKLRFVGVLSSDVKQLVVDHGLSGILEETGYVPHRQSVEYLMSSTMLLLVNPVVKNENMVIPGKIYEYLAARKPIINITLLTAETAAIVENSSAGKTFDRAMQADLEDWLMKQVADWKQRGTLDITGNEAIVKTYSQGEICNRLIEVTRRES